MSKKKTNVVERFDEYGAYLNKDGRVDPEDIKIDLKLATTVKNLVGKGLTNGVGNPKPGQMCVEAAVCYAIGQDHGDQPICVDPDLTSAKISLNDNFSGTKKERARILRRVAIAQLGTRDRFTASQYRQALEDAITNWVNYRFRAELAQAKTVVTDVDSLEEVIESLGNLKARFEDALAFSSYFGFDDVQDKIASVLSDSDIEETNTKIGNQAVTIAAELITQALIALKAPGAKFLHLVPLTKNEQKLFGVKK